MKHGRRASDTWKARLILGGAVLQVVFFVLNTIAVSLFLRTWASLEGIVAELQDVSRRARERLDPPESGLRGL